MKLAHMIGITRKFINPPYSSTNILGIIGAILLLVAIPVTVITTTTTRDTRSRASVIGVYSERVTIIHNDIEKKGFGDVDIIKKVTENNKEKVYLNGKLSSQREIEPILKKSRGEVLGAATCDQNIVNNPPLQETLTVPEGVTFCIYSTQVTATDVYNTFKANGMESHVKLTKVQIVDNGLSLASVGGGCYPLDYPVQGCWVFDATIQIRSALILSIPNDVIAHEYGHVWDNYYKWTNWRGEYDAYLDGRGLVGDPRLTGPSSATCWNPIETIADDYRVLFGENQSDEQICNRDIPHPKNVPGLNEFLALTYTNNSPPPNYIPTPADTANPTVTFTDPANGSTLTGDRAFVFLEALDDVAVHYVELYVDGKLFAVNAVNVDVAKGVPGLNDYRFIFDSTKLTNGNHTFQAKAYDLSGKSAVSSNLALSVSNTSSSPDTQEPTISIILPTVGTAISDSVYIVTSNSDDVGITKTELYVDGQWSKTDIIYPYVFKLDTNTLTNGNHNFVAKAYDWAGNMGTSSSVTLNVNNESSTPDTQDPVVTITTPADGSTVSDTVNISATATDNVGVTLMAISVNGQQKATSSSGSISFSWNTITESNGSYTILVTASDAFGNTGTESINVTVDNMPLPTSPGDINSDGIVNGFDLSILLNQWKDANAISDINGDGTTNGFDLSILLSNWGS